MSILLEVVFENVHKTKVIQLLMSLIMASEKVINFQCSQDIQSINKDKLNVISLSTILSFDGNVCVLLNVNNMKVGNVILPNVLLRMVKYSEFYDIDFNFDSEEFEDTYMTTLLTELHNHAKEVARDYNIADFFCGIEPASDKATRYFTNGYLGPLIN